MVATDPGNEMQSAFTQLVETYHKPLLNLCCMYLRDSTQAEDAVQEAFLKAYRALPSFRGECSHRTWLSRIAINVWNVICQGQIYPSQRKSAKSANSIGVSNAASFVAA